MSNRTHLDLAMDDISKIMKDVKDYLSVEYKNIQPFQSVKMSDDEIVAKYMMYPEEVKNKMRQDYPVAWTNYERKVQDIILKRGK